MVESLLGIDIGLYPLLPNESNEYKCGFKALEFMAMKIPVVELEGYEADDLIGTLAKQAEKEDYKDFMVTPDKDFGQLVSDKTFI